jgi:glycosyltransferase involved in cell wall biosynthesis
VVATLSGNEQGRALDLLVQQHPASNRPSVREAFHPIYDQYGPPLPAEEARITLGLQPKNGGGDPNGGASTAPRKVILFFGLIRPYKGLDLLLDAVSRLPTVELIVAGEPYMNIHALKERSGREDLVGRVHWHTDFIPADNVATYFSAADAVVLPYKKATNSGVGLTAVAFGKPLVVTPVGGLPSLISARAETRRGPSPDVNGAVAHDGGTAHDGAVANNWVPPYDGAVTANGVVAADVTADALANAIQSALSLDPQRVAAVQGELAQQWSWEALGRTLLETDRPADETSQ